MPQKNLDDHTRTCCGCHQSSTTTCGISVFPRVFAPLRPFWVRVPLPLVGNSRKPTTGPDEVVPTFSRTRERAEPAPKGRTFVGDHLYPTSPGPHEGQRQDRLAIADRVATYGLKVFCTDCGMMHRHRKAGGERLRNVPSPCCAARMRPTRWGGWDEWRRGTRATRREEAAPFSDGYVLRRSGRYYMRGLDS